MPQSAVPRTTVGSPLAFIDPAVVIVMSPRAFTLRGFPSAIVLASVGILAGAVSVKTGAMPCALVDIAVAAGQFAKPLPFTVAVLAHKFVPVVVPAVALTVTLAVAPLAVIRELLLQHNAAAPGHFAIDPFAIVHVTIGPRKGSRALLFASPPLAHVDVPVSKSVVTPPIHEPVKHLTLISVRIAQLQRYTLSRPVSVIPQHTVNIRPPSPCIRPLWQVCFAWTLVGLLLLYKVGCPPLISRRWRGRYLRPSSCCVAVSLRCKGW
mmetsp:Transcript_1569/g.2549  ORF Transcript_1569/g.2549 Transcript_1569/m.2549 type:complete len:265 (+) Transcript_1569:65-859(+)